MGKSGGIFGTILGAIGGFLIGGPIGAIAGAGIGGSVGGAISGFQTPQLPTPPSPANYYYYNDEGQVTQEMVWDASRNAYIYKTAPLTPEQRAEKAKRQELRAQILQNLNQTPEELQRRYEEYAQTFATEMRRPVEEQYEKTKYSIQEELAKRGLLGSKAYADIMSELAKQKQQAETEIAQKATLAKEELAKSDRDFWLQALGQLDAGQRYDTLLELQKAQQAAQAANLGTSALRGAYEAQALQAIQNWQARQSANQLLLNALGGTATGLMYLYGRGLLGGNKTTGAPQIQLTPPRVSNTFQLTPYGWIRY